MENQKYVIVAPVAAVFDFAIVTYRSSKDLKCALLDLEYHFQNRYPECRIVSRTCDSSDVEACIQAVKEMAVQK